MAPRTPSTPPARRETSELARFFTHLHIHSFHHSASEVPRSHTKQAANKTTIQSPLIKAVERLTSDKQSRRPPPAPILPSAVASPRCCILQQRPFPSATRRRPRASPTTEPRLRFVSSRSLPRLLPSSTRPRLLSPALTCCFQPSFSTLALPSSPPLSAVAAWSRLAYHGSRGEEA